MHCVFALTPVSPVSSLPPVQFLGLQPGYSHVLRIFVKHFMLAIVRAIVHHKVQPSAPLPGVQKYSPNTRLLFSGASEKSRLRPFKIFWGVHRGGCFASHRRFCPRFVFSTRHPGPSPRSPRSLILPLALALIFALISRFRCQVHIRGLLSLPVS